jgi:hypothetical protein
MPKWKSPLFSDIRNAIGDNVVFSTWKGRPFFRSYVIPANPQTNPQMAHRHTLTEILKRWQNLAADPDVVAAWNESALPYLISGYNLFLKWGRLSEVSVSPASGSAPLDVTITYKCGVPLARAKLYQLKGTTWSDVTPAAGLQASGTVNLTGLTAGTYYWFIADTETLKEGESSPQAYQAITKWKPDETNGQADECKCVVS